VVTRRVKFRGDNEAKRFLAIFTLKSAPIYSNNYFFITLLVNLSLLFLDFDEEDG